MADKLIKAPEQTSAIQSRLKEKDFNSKKKNKRNLKETEKSYGQLDFVDEVKKAFKYGDVGHGLIVDKKV